MKREAVRIGQHYSSAKGGYLGSPGPEWEVVSVTELNDGVTCARLAMTRDPTEQITLAVSVLQDPKIHRLVLDKPAESLAHSTTAHRDRQHRSRNVYIENGVNFLSPVEPDLVEDAA